MTRGLPLDREEIHLKIWNAREKRTGKVKIHQKTFAKFLGISPPHMSRIIKEFTTSGRLKKIGSTYRNVGVYVVSDPATFDGQLLATGLGHTNMVIRP